MHFPGQVLRVELMQPACEHATRIVSGMIDRTQTGLEWNGG